MILHALTAEFISTLASEGYTLGVGQQLRVQELLRHLPLQSTAKDLKYSLIPILAHSPEDQMRFGALFDECVLRNNLIIEELDLLLGKESNKSSKEPSIFSSKRRAVFIVFVVLIGLILGVGLGFKHFYPKTENGNLTVDNQNDLSLNEEIPKQKPKTVKDSILSVYLPEKPLPFNHDAQLANTNTPTEGILQVLIAKYWKIIRWLIDAFFTIGLILLGLYWAKRRRKLILEQTNKDVPPYIWDIKIKNSDLLLEVGDVQKIAQMMRRRALSEIYKIDILASVNSTIKSGGLPELCFRNLAEPVEYLFLIERKYFNNHRASLFDHLYRTLKSQEAEVERFFFDIDPRVCYNESTPEIRLADLQNKYFGSKVLLISTGGEFFSSVTGKLNNWVDTFKNWKTPVLFTPKPVNNWNRDERYLREIFTVLPATIQSIGFWLEESNTQERQFGDWRERVEDAPRSVITIVDDDPLPILQLYFSPLMLKWVAACAIYPTLNLDLTLWFAQKINIFLNQKIGDSGEYLTLSYPTLLNLFQIPWFIEGSIPTQGRARLLDWLEQYDPELLKHLRQELTNLISENPPPTGSNAYDEYNITLAINKLLTNDNKKETKKLQKKVFGLMKGGAVADFTILKYINRSKTILDLILPSFWKKYIVNDSSVQLKEIFHIKSFVMLLCIWAILQVPIFWPYKLNDLECKTEKIVYSLNGKQLNICLDSIKNALLLNEYLVLDAINRNNEDSLDLLLSGDKLWSDTVRIPNISLNRKALLDKIVQDAHLDSLNREIEQNFAFALYEKGRKLMSNGLDQSCFWFLKASRYDTFDLHLKLAAKLCIKTGNAQDKPKTQDEEHANDHTSQTSNPTNPNRRNDSLGRTTTNPGPNRQNDSLGRISNLDPRVVALLMSEFKQITLAEPVEEASDKVRPTLKNINSQEGLFKYQWNFGGLRNTKYAGADVIGAWQFLGNKGSGNVTIAVVNNGFDLTHPELRNSVVKPYDFWTNSSQVLQGDARYTQGTPVASIALARENGVGMIGVAPNSQFMPVSGTSFSVRTTEAIFNYCSNNGADVVICAWGSTDPNYQLNEEKKQIIGNAAKNGRNGKGCVILFPVGNDQLNYINYYAQHPDVIAVAACTDKGIHAPYSNTGTGIAVCAPSNGGWPVIAARAWWDQGDTRETGERRYWIDGENLGNQYKDFGGTSSAVSFVGGICALMLSANPDLTAKEVKEILCKTAQKIGNSADYENGYSKKYGYGLVNALEAVKEAKRRIKN